VAVPVPDQSFPNNFATGPTSEPCDKYPKWKRTCLASIRI
jgi:hypothetical protein